MPKPTGNDLHPVSELDTEFAIALGPDLEADFVADLSVPPDMLTGDKDRFDYFVWSKRDMYRREMKQRGDNAASAIGGFGVTTSDARTKTYALKTFMSDRERARAQAPVMADQAHIYYLMAQAKLNRDAVFADAFFGTGLWTSNTEQTGVSGSPSTNQFKQFNDAASTPLLTLQTYMKTVHLKCGRYPNFMLTNLKVSQALGRHANFTGRVTGGATTQAPGLVDVEQIAAVLWAGAPKGSKGRIVVSSGVEDTAKEGDTESMADLFGNHILLAYVDPAAKPLFDKARPTAMATWAWSTVNGMTSSGHAIKAWRDDDPDGDWRRVEDDYVAKITSNDCGIFLLTAVA